jgi:antitoxin MazE
MRLAKWGNSLAVRVPSSVVEALDLKEGDDIEISIAGAHEFRLGVDHAREAAIRRIRSMRRPLPPGWKFDREEANAR